MAYNTKYWQRSAWESLKNSLSSTITMSSECNTQWLVLFFRVWIVVIASAVIVLAWLQKKRKKESQKIDDLPVLATCQLVLQRCSPAKLTVPLCMETLGKVANVKNQLLNFKQLIPCAWRAHWCLNNRTLKLHSRAYIASELHQTALRG